MGRAEPRKTMSAVNKWLKRLLLLFAIALAALSAAFYVLYFRRTPLPPAAPHALVAPSIASLPGLSACWIETGKTFSNFSFGSTAGTILVRHPAGDLLIDTGNSSHFDDEIRGYPFLTWSKLRFLAGQLKPDVPLSELLRRVKEDPAKLRWVILSHAHLDHSGGLMDLPRLPVLLSQEELQFANDPSVQAKGYVVGTLRGHTPGSVGIFVNLSPNRRLFYAGDAVDDERGFEERVGKSLILRDSDNDEALANQIVARLSELHEKLPELRIIPAHGRSAYQKFFLGGPLSCVSSD